MFGAPGSSSIRNMACSPYAPVYILAATGLAVMWRAGRDSRRLAVETTIAFVALTATVGAFRIWWGGTASPGRPLASGLLLLALPISMAAAAAPVASAQRAAHHVLLWISVGIAATLMLAEQGLADQQRTRRNIIVAGVLGAVRRRLVAGADVHFSRSADGVAALDVWLLVAGVAAFIISRWRTKTAGRRRACRADDARCGTAGARLRDAGSAARSTATDLEPRVALASRPARQVRHRLAADCDSLRSISRRVGGVGPAVRVASCRTGHAPRSATHSRAPQRPILIAGGTLSGGCANGQEGCRAARRSVCRLGATNRRGRRGRFSRRPVRTGASTSILPVDASFVGFRGGTDLERAIGRLTIKPISVVDESARLARPHRALDLAVRERLGAVPRQKFVSGGDGAVGARRPHVAGDDQPPERHDPADVADSHGPRTQPRHNQHARVAGNADARGGGAEGDHPA